MCLQLSRIPLTPQYIMKYRKLICLLFATSSVALAQNIGTYEFTANSLAVTDANGGDGITMSSVSTNSLGSLFDNGNLDGTGSVSDFLRLSGPDVSASIGDALSNNEFLSFSVTNHSGEEIALTSVSLDYQKIDTFGLGSYVYSDVQGFDDATNDLIGNFIGTYESGSDASFVTDTIALGSGSYGGSNVADTDFVLSDGESISFYIAFRFNSTSNTRAVDLDNLTLAYSAVPEPGSYALLAGLIAATALVMKRRQN